MHSPQLEVHLCFIEQSLGFFMIIVGVEFEQNVWIDLDDVTADVTSTNSDSFLRECEGEDHWLNICGFSLAISRLEQTLC